MSDDVFKIIPEQPDFVPDTNTQQQAKEYLSSLFLDQTAINFLVNAEVEFIDAGVNMELVTCPYCQTEVSLDWWSGAMDRGYEVGFTKFEITLPCCGTKSSLTELRYYWPCGFARSVIEVYNPVREIIKIEIRVLEEILETNLLTFWAHY